MSAIEKSLLSHAEARSLTDEVKNDAERLWRKLVELYEGGAHEVLGYKSWGAYFKAEFGGSERRGYQLLEAGRVMEQLAPVQNFALPKNDHQARELLPLHREPEAMREAWAEVVEMHPEPTAKDVREVVARYIDPKPDLRIVKKKTAPASPVFFTDELDLIEHFEKGWQALAHATHPDHREVWQKLDNGDRADVLAAAKELSTLLDDLVSLLSERTSS